MKKTVLTRILMRAVSALELLTYRPVSAMCASRSRLIGLSPIFSSTAIFGTIYDLEAEVCYKIDNIENWSWNFPIPKSYLVGRRSKASEGRKGDSWILRWRCYARCCGRDIGHQLL